jgi:predicted permease
MLKNYLITAFRNLWRKKSSSFINIAGLSLGIASSLVLFLLIKHHLGFDSFHSKADRIYRVVNQSKGNNGNNYTSGVPAVLPDAFRTDFSEAEVVAFTSYRAGALILVPQKDGDQKKYEEERGVVYTQPEFFKIFDRAVLIGDVSKGLDEPNEAVISTELAMKYFGREDVVGEIVKYENADYRISAVVENPPTNTDFPFTLMLSYATIKKQQEENGWNSIWSDEQCYFLLKEGESIAKLEQRIPAFVKKYRGDDNRDESTFLFQPLRDIHYDDRFSNYNYNTMPRSVLISLGVIGIFLIVTACINFINLSTAEAIKRSKEVGIRKSLGSSRMQLVNQFLGETTIVTVLSVVAAVGIVQLSLGFLNPFLELQMTLGLTNDAGVWAFLIVITLAVSLLSGLYPSFVVSAYKPALALKNLISNKNSSGFQLRRALVLTQFTISQVFIIGTLVLISQTAYFQKKDLGFRKDAIVNIPIPERESPAGVDGSSKMRTLKDEVSRLAGVQSVSLNSSPPSSGSVSGTNFKVEGKEDDFGTQVKQVDGNYVDLFGLKIVAGENIVDLDTATGFIVNEKLVKTAGFAGPHEMVGKRIRMWGKELPVVGVVNDFHTVSLSSALEPVILLNRIRGYQNLSITVNPANMQETIKQVQARWEAAYPNYIFSYEFMDEQIRGFYDGERRMSVMLTIFTSLAIFIGCLGLFGLATFMANQKTKEIGVRKVLGASVPSIVYLFSKEFVKLILIGFVVAAPIAWYFMNEYLNQFAYKITLGPSLFIAGMGITLLIAMVTVGYRSFKAATINPVDSLKCE